MNKDLVKIEVSKDLLLYGLRYVIKILDNNIKLSNEFKESEHKRDKVGRFAEKGKSDNYKEIFERIKSEVDPEVRAKMEKVNIDFEKDNILPELNKEDLEELELKKDYPVRLKKNIIARQDLEHTEIKKEDVNMLLATALYNPDIKAEGKGEGYIHFVKKLGNNKNSLVLLDIKENYDGFYDIVHYFFIREKSKKQMLKK
ncbi:MAG: hypothetical protein LBF97_02150 [Elusimicrobiota bacterium]|jgi:hypothetical protein|nr:hypothetical protein [Elusimicrobiota bacterium]